MHYLLCSAVRSTQLCVPVLAVHLLLHCTADRMGWAWTPGQPHGDTPAGRWTRGGGL